jgi:hypothetical protein
MVNIIDPYTDDPYVTALQDRALTAEHQLTKIGKRPQSPAELTAVLMREESLETAVAVYKEALSYISAYEEVKRAALSCAQAELDGTGELKRVTPVGNAGWTSPNKGSLDKEAWLTAVQEHDELRQVQLQFEEAKSHLEDVQRPFLVKRPGFYIR